MLFSAAHRPANCVLFAFFWYRSFFSPLVPSATRTRFERTRALTVCLLLFIVYLSSLLFGFSSWSFLSSFSPVPPILFPVEASCLFILRTTVVLSLHLFPFSLVLYRLAFIAASFPRICGGWAFPKSRLAPRLSATTWYSACT